MTTNERRKPGPKPRKAHWPSFTLQLPPALHTVLETEAANEGIAMGTVVVRWLQAELQRRAKRSAP